MKFLHHLSNTNSSSPYITSYDLLKSFAVLIMIIDHLGAYQIVNTEWMRAIGRIGFPIWFFLVGHAKSRGVPAVLWFGAFILLFADIFIGRPILPLNALFTIIFIRLSIDRIILTAQRNYFQLCVLSLFLAFLIIPSEIFFEYGTMAFITAMYGYFVRHKKTINNMPMIIGFMLFSLLCFVAYMQFKFRFDIYPALFMIIGTFVVRIYLLYFQKQAYPKLNEYLPRFFAVMIRYCGQRTLEIYVIHLLLLKCVALYFIPEMGWIPLSFIGTVARTN